MDERFTTEVVANTQECRVEARIFISGDPNYEYPEAFAIVFEMPSGWRSELPTYWNEEEVPWGLIEEALEESADLLMSYSNRTGENTPAGLESANLEEWLLQMDPLS